MLLLYGKATHRIVQSDVFLAEQYGAPKRRVLSARKIIGGDQEFSYSIKFKCMNFVFSFVIQDVEMTTCVEHHRSLVILITFKKMMYLIDINVIFKIRKTSNHDLYFRLWTSRS